jgi:hypothetical protein
VTCHVAARRTVGCHVVTGQTVAEAGTSSGPGLGDLQEHEGRAGPVRTDPTPASAVCSCVETPVSAG